jgi:hypothetical protein
MWYTIFKETTLMNTQETNTPKPPEGKKLDASRFIVEVERIRSVLLKNDPHRFSETSHIETHAPAVSQ